MMYERKERELTSRERYFRETLEGNALQSGRRSGGGQGREWGSRLEVEAIVWVNPKRPRSVQKAFYEDF